MQEDKPKTDKLHVKEGKSESFLENLGTKYFNNLSKKLKSDSTIHLKNIPSDKVLQVAANHVILNSVIIAFLVGALTTVPIVLFEMLYKESMDTMSYYISFSLVTAGMLILEIGSLYWLGMKSVHTLAHLTGFEDYEEEQNLPPEYDVANIMVRTALEIPDPAIEYLGINPQKYVSKKWLVFTAILYKAKVVLSSIILKLVLRKLAARYGVRVGFIWIAIPVTAAWDAFVMYKVVKDAKLRLFGYQLSKFIINEVLTDKILSDYPPHTREGAIRAISTVMVLSDTYHPNNVILLIRLSQNLEIIEKSDYDDLDKFLNHLDEATVQEKHFLRTLAGIAAVFDGVLNKKEKAALKMIFSHRYDEYIEMIEELRFLLTDGQLHKSAALCKEKLLEVQK
jgi:hypothetical protein